MESLLPIGIAAISIGLTYVMCTRPMRRGTHCVMMSGKNDARALSGGLGEPAEIERLRREVAMLRRDVSHDRAGGHPTWRQMYERPV